MASSLRLSGRGPVQQAAAMAMGWHMPSWAPWTLLQGRHFWAASASACFEQPSARIPADSCSKTKSEQATTASKSAWWLVIIASYLSKTHLQQCSSPAAPCHRFALYSPATMQQPDILPACLVQPRKRQKHVAEYVADRPLCGSWAELDGELSASLHDSDSVQAETPDPWTHLDRVWWQAHCLHGPALMSGVKVLPGTSCVLQACHGAVSQPLQGMN